MRVRHVIRAPQPKRADEGNGGGKGSRQSSSRRGSGRRRRKRRRENWTGVGRPAPDTELRVMNERNLNSKRRRGVGNAAKERHRRWQSNRNVGELSTGVNREAKMQHL